MSGEALRLRLDDLARDDDATRTPPDSTTGSPSVVVQTTTLGTYPTVAAAFYACIPVSVFGPEIEGGAGALTAAGPVRLVLNIGSKIPPIGTYAVATYVGNRWVFRYDG